MAKKKAEEYTINITKKPVPYEMVVVFKPFLPDKVRIESDQKIEKIINDAKGVVTSRDIWGKRYLSYEVQGHTEGYYVMYQFEAPGLAMDEVKKAFNRHPEILRYLVVKKDTMNVETSKIKVKKTISEEK